MQPSDEELVAAVRSGDAPALGALLERHRAGMTAAALRVLGHGPDLEDIVQDACLEGLVSIDRLRDGALAGPWLRGIARHLALRRVRTKRVERRTLPRIGVPEPVPSAAASLERRAMRDWLWTALGELSEPVRLTLLLRYFSEARSYREIAALAGVPIGTVRSRYRIPGDWSHASQSRLPGTTRRHVRRMRKDR